MTTAQRIIAAMGLVLIFGRFLSAPYRFEGVDAAHPHPTGEDSIVTGRVHAPVWAPPRGADLVDRARVRLRSPALQLERVSVQLDVVRVTLWVVAIGTITVLAIGAPGSRFGRIGKPHE